MWPGGERFSRLLTQDRRGSRIHFTQLMGPDGQSGRDSRQDNRKIPGKHLETDFGSYTADAAATSLARHGQHERWPV